LLFQIVLVATKKTLQTPRSKNGGFIPAMLEEDTKIKNQSSVVFFLLEDCTIDGSVFKKNSILYGKASEHGGVFDINIYQIMNTDGNISPVTGLLVFDEKYSRGLAYEGSLNESVREGMGKPPVKPLLRFHLVLLPGPALVSLLML